MIHLLQFEKGSIGLTLDRNTLTKIVRSYVLFKMIVRFESKIYGVDFISRHENIGNLILINTIV